MSGQSVIVVICRKQCRFKHDLSYIGDTSIVSQSVTNNRCAPSCGGGAPREKCGGHIKNFSSYVTLTHNSLHYCYNSRGFKE